MDALSETLVHVKRVLKQREGLFVWGESKFSVGFKFLVGPAARDRQALLSISVGGTPDGSALLIANTIGSYRVDGRKAMTRGKGFDIGAVNRKFVGLLDVLVIPECALVLNTNINIPFEHPTLLATVDAELERIRSCATVVSERVRSDGSMLFNGLIDPLSMRVSS